MGSTDDGRKPPVSPKAPRACHGHVMITVTAVCVRRLTAAGPDKRETRD